MKKALLITILMFPLILLGEPLQYFKELHDKPFESVQPIESYHDPDQFYSDIAKELGIPKLAFNAVVEKYKWEEKEFQILQGIVKRSERKWIAMIYRLEIDPRSKKPKMDSMISKWVEINDKLEVIYCGSEQRKSETSEPVAAHK